MAHRAREQGRACWYLSGGHLVATVHRQLVLFTHGIGHMQGDSRHEGGPVEQVPIQAVVPGQALLVVRAAGPLPLGPHSLQGHAGCGGRRPAGIQGSGGVGRTQEPQPLRAAPVRRRAARSCSGLARSSRKACFLSSSWWARLTLGGGNPMSISSLGSAVEREGEASVPAPGPPFHRTR